MRRLLIALLLALVVVPVAGAHPLGNFTVNQYARIQVAPSGVHGAFRARPGRDPDAADDPGA